MLKTDTLDDLNDSDLTAVILYAEGLLKKRDGERKAKAMDDARAILAAAGISMKELNGRNKAKPKSPAHRIGHKYQHPTNKDLLWNGKGKKPGWLTTLESQGKSAVEVVSA